MDLQLFFWTSLIIIMAPGPNSILIIQASIELGMPYALSVLAGAALATAGYCVLTGLGLAAILNQAPMVFNIIKFLGCFYIMYLGIMGIYAGVNIIKAHSDNTQSPIVIKHTNKLNLFFKGFLTGALNIATILLILSIFPQFIINQENMIQEWLFLSAIFITIHISWYISLICVLVSLRQYFLKPLVQGSIKIVTSSLLIFLAIKILIN